jgi:hypothetical protein
MGDVFVAACRPDWSADGLPLQSGGPVTVGQPFADIALLDNTFVQEVAQVAIAIYGSDGLILSNNAITLVDGGAGGADGAGGSSIEGSLDGFDVGDGAARVGGWVVDTNQPATLPSNVTFLVDGLVVLTVVANYPRPDLVPKVTSDPHHGFEVVLPAATYQLLLHGNHTLSAVVAHPAGGVHGPVVLHGGPACVTPFRRSCHFPQSCLCGAPTPPTIQISNSLRCMASGNACYGKACPPLAANACT